MRSDDFKKGLVKISTIYDCKFSSDKVTLWWKLFSHFSYDVFDKAIDQHIMDPFYGNKIPLPSDINKKITNSHSINDDAVIGWATIFQDLRKHKKIPSGYDEILRDSILAVGGWQSLRKLDREKANIKRREFIDVFCAFSRRNRKIT